MSVVTVPIKEVYACTCTYGFDGYNDGYDRYTGVRRSRRDTTSLEEANGIMRSRRDTTYLEERSETNGIMDLLTDDVMLTKNEHPAENTLKRYSIDIPSNIKDVSYKRGLDFPAMRSGRSVAPGEGRSGLGASRLLFSCLMFLFMWWFCGHIKSLHCRLP